MLFTIQFPFADCRRFLDSEAGVISHPSWPAPSLDEFVRCFGGVRERFLGGLEFWGEDIICQIRRSIRFKSIPCFVAKDGRRIPIEVAFRRLYCDGLALGKFEVGLATVGRRHDLDRIDATALLMHLLSMDVEVASPNGLLPCPLASAATPLVNAYVTATTRCKHTGASSWAVTAGTPLLFLHRRAEDAFTLPFFTYHGPDLREWGITIKCCLLPFRGRNLRMWVLTLGRSADRTMARALRLSLSRLHAEHESIRLVCRNVSSNRIPVSHGTKASEYLQHYINTATKRIARSERTAKRLESGDASIVDLTRSIADAIHPGECDSLLEALRQAGVRKNIVDKIANYTRRLAAYGGNVIITEELNMSNDKYEVHGGAGAVGQNAQAHNVNIINYQAAWDGLRQQVDLASLVGQLEQLQGELRTRAQTSDDFRSLAEVVSASEAAKANDGSRVLQHLKTAGAWALDVAQKIGVSVAAKAIQSAIGL